MNTGKVLMINGSFRKQNTYRLLVQIGELLKQRGIESEILNLFDYEIKHCTGCDEICIHRGNCHIRDGMPIIMQKILESDGLVLGSPVYLYGPASKIKAFADRTNVWFHKPEPASIPVLCVATATVTGLKDTCRFFDQYSAGLGARKAGFITRTKANLASPVSEKEVARFVSLVETDKNQYRPSMNEIALFEVQKVLALKSSGADRQFWEEKKWIDKSYYYDCKINFAKKAFSRMMFRILSGAMK